MIFPIEFLVEYITFVATRSSPATSLPRARRRASARSLLAIRSACASKVWANWSTPFALKTTSHEAGASLTPALRRIAASRGLTSMAGLVRKEDL